MENNVLQMAKTKKKQLLDRKRRLVDELASIERTINEIARFESMWNALLSDDGELPVENLFPDEGNESTTAVSTPRKATGNSRKEKVAAAAREIILERGEPIMRDELYGLLTGRGLTIEGRDPYMVLSTMLWRMSSEIVRVEGQGYWPAGVKNDDIGYDPEESGNFDSMLNSPLDEVPDPDSEEYRDASDSPD